MGDRAAANTASRNALAADELLARLEGLLAPAANLTVNVDARSVHLTLQTTILQALGPYPEARLAVAQIDGEAG